MVLECLLIEEVEGAIQLTKECSRPPKLIFAPNFCGWNDYERAYNHGEQYGGDIEVVVNNIEAFTARPDLFKGKEVILQVDPATSESSEVFLQAESTRLSHALADLSALVEAAQAAGAVVVGLQVRCSQRTMRER